MDFRNLFREKKPTLDSNNIIWMLTINDIFTWGINLVVITLVGLYFAEKIDGDPKTIVGIGTAIAYVARAFTQIPFGLLGDHFKKDLDEVIMLVVGNKLMGSAILGYTIINQAWQYYALQQFLESVLH
ncbi:MAG: hypothetical protein ACOCXP_01290 [Candidatus Dojkabacteria bacterium]